MITRKTKHVCMVVGITALCLAVGVIAVKAGSDIVLANATGQVEVRNHQATTWKSVSTGTSLHLGDVIRTGAQSKAEIRFESGIIRMYENTILELPSQSKQLKVSDDSGQLRKVFLQRGRSLFEVFKKRLNGGFEVSSPSLIAGVKGTTFRVTEEEKIKGVTVFEGIVSVTNRQRHEEMIEVMANHFTLLSEGRLLPAREFQIENPALEERREEQRIQARREDRLRDQIEKNRDVQGEAVSSSLRIDSSTTDSRLLDSTLNTTGSVVNDTTGTLDGIADSTQSTLNDTTGTVTGTVDNTSATLNTVTEPLIDSVSTILSLP
ncbi:MAG: FecR family protein [Nitrospira sp.]|nr:FecR family protein [Nitrospira sp.]